MEKQVDKDHYSFHNYCGRDRWGSYYYQIKVILDREPKNILEVGSGDEVLRNYLENNADIEFKNLDIAEDLDPDVLGSVTSIPLPDDSFDISCAFEVLEHLPFDQFEIALQEMKRVAKEYVILSLPHFGPMISGSFKVPFIKNKEWAYKIPVPKEHHFNGEHYWEIGKKGYSIRKIRSILEKHFEIVEDFIPHENAYHHFFVLKHI